MGRPMRPVDPMDGPVQEFAAALRALRERAGNPTFRQLAKRAHYSATTLSVACSGTVLPSADVALALVRACGGDERAWRRQWRAAAGQPQAGDLSAEPTARTAPPKPARALVRRVLPWTGWAAAAAVAISLAWVTAADQPAAGQPAAGQPAGHARTSASTTTGLTRMYVGITRCDPGSYPVQRAKLTLPRPIRLAGRAFPAGAVVGVVYLMFSPTCSEGWPHFSPSAAFFNLPGVLTLRSLSTPDGSLNTSPQFKVIRYADGEPMLTVPGCVNAEATIEFGPGGPTVTAATPCFQRG